MDTETLDDTFREYAWNYFKLHANQRLKAFDFYIIFSTAISGGFLLALHDSHGQKWYALMGITIVFLSYVFWQLDERTRHLIKLAEDALKYLDAQHDLPDVDGAPHPLRIISRDDHLATLAKLSFGGHGHYSYTRSFRLVFAMFSFLGLAQAIACLLLFPT